MYICAKLYKVTKYMIKSLCVYIYKVSNIFITLCLVLGSRWDETKQVATHTAPATLCYHGDVFCEAEDENRRYARNRYLTVQSM